MEHPSRLGPDEHETGFSYKYSARTPDEKTMVKRIRDQYVRNDDKLDQLRRLDQKVKSPGTALSIVFGVIGTLILGLGLAMVFQWDFVVLGAFVGIIGMLILGLAYPLYILVTKKRKAQYASEIIRLSDELLNK